ncbi:hypothetical protein Pelo_4135 [Pelomyxa schiedti]|nr:hypothetical protein Pelo_4135 [Pelomyxa schiedti]
MDPYQQQGNAVNYVTTNTTPLMYNNMMPSWGSNNAQLQTNCIQNEQQAGSMFSPMYGMPFFPNNVPTAAALLSLEPLYSLMHTQNESVEPLGVVVEACCAPHSIKGRRKRRKKKCHETQKKLVELLALQPLLQASELLDTMSCRDMPVPPLINWFGKLEDKKYPFDSSSDEEITHSEYLQMIHQHHEKMKLLPKKRGHKHITTEHSGEDLQNQFDSQPQNGTAPIKQESDEPFQSQNMDTQLNQALPTHEAQVLPQIEYKARSGHTRHRIALPDHDDLNTPGVRVHSWLHDMTVPASSVVPTPTGTINSAPSTRQALVRISKIKSPKGLPKSDIYGGSQIPSVSCNDLSVFLPYAAQCAKATVCTEQMNLGKELDSQTVQSLTQMSIMHNTTIKRQWSPSLSVSPVHSFLERQISLGANAIISTSTSAASALAPVIANFAAACGTKSPSSHNTNAFGGSLPAVIVAPTTLQVMEWKKSLSLNSEKSKILPFFGSTKQRAVIKNFFGTSKMTDVLDNCANNGTSTGTSFLITTFSVIAEEQTFFSTTPWCFVVLDSPGLGVNGSNRECLQAVASFLSTHFVVACNSILEYPLQAVGLLFSVFPFLFRQGQVGVKLLDNRSQYWDYYASEIPLIQKLLSPYTFNVAQPVQIPTNICTYSEKPYEVDSLSEEINVPFHFNYLDGRAVSPIVFATPKFLFRKSPSHLFSSYRIPTVYSQLLEWVFSIFNPLYVSNSLHPDPVTKKPASDCFSFSRFSFLSPADIVHLHADQSGTLPQFHVPNGAIMPPHHAKRTMFLLDELWQSTTMRHWHVEPHLESSLVVNTSKVIAYKPRWYSPDRSFSYHQIELEQSVLTAERPSFLSISAMEIMLKNPIFKLVVHTLRSRKTSRVAILCGEQSIIPMLICYLRFCNLPFCSIDGSRTINSPGSYKSLSSALTWAPLLVFLLRPASVRPSATPLAEVDTLILCDLEGDTPIEQLVKSSWFSISTSTKVIQITKHKTNNVPPSY